MRSATFGSLGLVLALFALNDCSSSSDAGLIPPVPSAGSGGTSGGAGGTSNGGVGGSAGTSGASGSSNGGAGAAGKAGGGAGASGAAGASGSASGEAGASGSAGTSGDAGASGSAGAGGDAGASGSAGAGAGGDAGTSGSAGTSGDAGSGGSGPPPCAGACDAALCVNDQCVACTPTDDACPKGQYCKTDNTCAQGCKTGADCASGVCNAVNECTSCISDLECSADHVCNAGTCGAPCTTPDEGTTTDCSNGLSCCSLKCSDLGSDVKHCGACGTPCTSGQFCGVNGCADSTIANLCNFTKITVVLDGASIDDADGRSIAAAVSSQCTAHPPVTEVMQGSTPSLNPTTGQPVTHGEQLLVATGSGYFQKVTDFLTKGAIIPVQDVLNGNTLEYRASADNSLLASEPYNLMPDPNHDIFVIQFVRDAASGTLLLNIQGFWATGTDAGALYFENVMLPSLATYTKPYYVGEWQNVGTDMPIVVDLSEISLITPL
ncbi:MAG TPA: hypothetical protein VGI10_26335 [Polyangiaceae bacterium]